MGFQGYLFLRGLSVIVLVFYCLVYLSSIHHENFMAIEEVVDSFHFWIEVITTILFLKNLDSHKIWTQSIRTTTLLASAFLFYYVGFIQRILDSDGPALPTLRSALFFASFAVGVFSFIQWLRRLAVHLRQSNLHLRLSSLSFNDYYIVVIITNWIIFLLSMTIIKTIYDSSSVEYRVIVTVFRTIYTFVIAFVPGRMIRHESLQYYLSSETEHLDRENKRLEDMLNMKRTFVRHVSHEVRTPLNTVCNGLELVKTSLHPYKDKIPEVFADLADIEESCHTAVDILTDLLTYEKLEAGLMTLERSRVPVVDLIEKALAPFRIQARNKQIHMDLTYSNSIESVALRDHTVEVDTTKMSQVVRNLCSNAIKFTPKHGSVDVSCIFIESQGQSVVQLVFKDSGCGMAAEDLLRLFGEGVQFNASTNQGGGGSGMGLWISKKIVELHGGIIVASSEGAGLGSSFKLELGLLQPPHNGAPQHIPNNTPVMESSAIPTNVFVKERSSTSTKHPSFPQWQLGSNNMAKVVPYELSPNDVLRFLLVDDSALTRRMINRLLVSRGHSCIEAEDGDDAVKKYQAADGAYDVILMDNLMPNCTGPEASKKLRDQGYRGLIIGATGNCLPEEVQAFMDTGVDKVMNKPVSADDLLSTIKELKAQSSRNTYA